MTLTSYSNLSCSNNFSLHKHSIQTHSIKQNSWIKSRSRNAPTIQSFTRSIIADSATQKCNSILNAYNNHMKLKSLPLPRDINVHLRTPKLIQIIHCPHHKNYQFNNWKIFSMFAALTNTGTTQKTSMELYLKKIFVLEIMPSVKATANHTSLTPATSLKASRWSPSIWLIRKILTLKDSIWYLTLNARSNHKYYRSLRCPKMIWPITRTR